MESIKAILKTPAVRFLIDVGKPISSYKSFLNRCTPSRSKYRGVYATFNEAKANVQKGASIGYDNERAAVMYLSYVNFILPSDYPVIFWLRDALRSGVRVFDFGGNVGISFYSFEKYLNYPKDLEWVVCDVPSVVKAGQNLANQRKETRLSFASRFEDADGFDILLASGSLQYIARPLGELLSRLKRPPRHVLINRLPLHDTRECVTLQNIGVTVCPYYVFRKDRFITDVQASGYELQDLWTDATHSCMIPFYPEYSVPRYSGLYFSRPPCTPTG